MGFSMPLLKLGWPLHFSMLCFWQLPPITVMRGCFAMTISACCLSQSESLLAHTLATSMFHINVDIEPKLTCLASRLCLKAGSRKVSHIPQYQRWSWVQTCRHPHESLVAAGRASGQNLLPGTKHSTSYVGMSEPFKEDCFKLKGHKRCIREVYHFVLKWIQMRTHWYSNPSSSTRHPSQ